MIMLLSQALAVRLHETAILKDPTSRSLIFFPENSGCDSKQFRGVSIHTLPIAEDVVDKNIYNYDMDIEDGDFL